jgi:hypothetical protein
MTDRKPPKKSEMLEVRIPHPTKAAFMDKARAEGRPASAIVRESIDLYLAGGAHPPTLKDKPIMFIKTYARLLVLLAGGAAAAIAMGAAISPASAQPDLRTAFAALDADGDGGISLMEFTHPRKALTTDLSTAQPGPDARIAVAAPRGSGDPVYVRYMLDTGAAGGVLPLLVMVDLPSGGPQSADVAALAGKAFASLDRNADGKLTADEFERG